MNKEILRLTIPNIITNVTVPLLGIVDLALMGHLESEEYIGAVAIGGIIFSFIYAFFSFLRMGTSGFAAQAYGSDNKLEIRLIFLRSLLLALVGGLLLIMLMYPINKLSFFLLNSSENIEILASEYFYIRIFAAPATLCLYVLYGWFLGLQNAKFPMIIAIVVNIVNIGFNFIFVMGFGMKSDGVALGTVIAQYSGLLMAIFLAFKYYRKEIQWISWKIIMELEPLKRFFAVNRDILIRTVLLIFTFSFFTAVSARLGDTILAVNTILLQYFMIFSYLIDGFAYAAEALTGKYVGRKSIVDLKRLIKHLFSWGLGISILFTIIYIVSGEYFLLILTNNSLIIEGAQPYMFWIAVVPLITFVSFLWDGIFIGATASVPMRNAMIISTIFVFLPSYFIFRDIIGNHGLWLALMLFMVARGILMTIYSKRILI